MAEGDPTIPDMTASTQSAEEAALAMTSLKDAANGAQDSIQGLNIAYDAANRMFTGLSSVMSGYSFSLKNIGELTDQQTAQVALLTTGMLGARRAFEGLNGVDMGNMRTFKDQFTELSATVSSSPFLNAAGQAQTLINALNDMGAPAQDVKKAAEGGVKTLVSYGSAFFESADNALRLQNALIQLSAKTGSLSTLYSKASDDLSGMNSIMAQQNAIIAETVKATGLNERQVESYFAALGTVPKAMESTVSSLDSMTGGTNMLTATIKLATGDGRKYEDVITDLHTAFKEYGVVGEDALKFTQRFTDISSTFGIELDDVRTNLMGATNSFKSFADAGASASRMSESLSGIMNDYIDGLQKSGMTGERSIRVVKDMTDSIAGLGVAQKAFLSGQTGGPGGLMGAFQIEKMMKEGKIDEVFDKVRQTMQKQFGKIVTLDEASQSQAAASQLQKQMLLLQKGPLGSMVKSDQDAYRLLETFRAKQDGRQPADMGIKGLSTQSTQQAIDRGTSIQEKSFTQLSAINANIAAMRRAADVPNLGIVQKSGAASSGAPDFLGPDSPNQMLLRKSLTDGMANAAAKGGELSKTYKDQSQGNTPLDDMSGVSPVDAINDFTKWFSQASTMATAPFDTMKQTFNITESISLPEQKNNLIKDIQERRSNSGATVGAAAAQSAAKVQSMQPAQTATTGASSTLTPEVRVTEEGASGRMKVLVNVQVVENGGQGKSITPIY